MGSVKYATQKTPFFDRGPPPTSCPRLTFCHFFPQYVFALVSFTKMTNYGMKGEKNSLYTSKTLPKVYLFKPTVYQHR